MDIFGFKQRAVARDENLFCREMDRLTYQAKGLGQKITFRGKQSPGKYFIKNLPFLIGQTKDESDEFRKSNKIIGTVYLAGDFTEGSYGIPDIFRITGAINSYSVGACDTISLLEFTSGISSDHIPSALPRFMDEQRVYSLKQIENLNPSSFGFYVGEFGIVHLNQCFSDRSLGKIVLSGLSDEAPRRVFNLPFEEKV
jgi:hypothetical protein